ncbi:MAG: hypothetical protein DI537_05525 [Stutzerimonas stutzeri]|nr:MAG: hypothetical protein DI537_05525 [Stutzerimonas stutzeri]
MNNVCITGYLGKNPEITFFPDSGNYEATLSVSTRRYGRQPQTDWHTVCVKASDTVQNLIKPHAKTGMLVSISGDLGYETFAGRDGQNIRIAKIFVRHAANFQLIRTSGPDARSNIEETAEKGS